MDPQEQQAGGRGIISARLLLSALTAEDPSDRPTRVTVATAAPASQLSVAAVDASGRRRRARRKPAQQQEGADVADGAGRLSGVEELRRSSAEGGRRSSSSPPSYWEVDGSMVGYVTAMVDETPTDPACRYRLRRLDEHWLPCEPLAFLFGLTHRYNTHGCTRMLAAARCFGELLSDDDDAAEQLRAALAGPAAARASSLSSAMAALAFLAVSEGRQLLPVAAR